MVIMEKSNANPIEAYSTGNQKLPFVVNLTSYNPEMLTAANLYNPQGAILVAENTALTPKMIKTLQDIGISKIRAYYKPIDLPISAGSKKFEETYKQAVFLLKEIINVLLIGGKIDINKVEGVSELIMETDNDINLVLKPVVVDEYLYTHSLNVAMISMLIAKWLKFDKSKTKDLVKSALLHDIGKCKINQNILNKKGPLLPEEYSKVKAHVSRSLEMLGDITPNLSADVCAGVYLHHERCDGTGYPKGLKGENIHEFARVIAIADVYDAMTSNKLYHPKQSPFDVFEYIQSGNMAGLDVKITLTFLEKVAHYYIGDTFMLNSGDLCKIVLINPIQISRPLIKIGENYIDLMKNNDLKIITIS